MYDCDEKKTTDMIQLLQSLQNKYALSHGDGSFKEPVFFGGIFKKSTIKKSLSYLDIVIELVIMIAYEYNVYLYTFMKLTIKVIFHVFPVCLYFQETV